ncbi:MAG: FAD binding domain-containing protein [Armatimonadota bacterium]|nr:FAD binding domain-containing protein [Armatimonadota bacterium]MDR7460751.1 FAD binding domain-containing protein [Armatimonadota bacterium]MDR7480643.1 FAD binding domain-containing protein [Armatimonadota bacterium]MDR7488367.1 FAD binding domain-containing protein [Armatimonadota bacterium]MDR7491046.1 FAD binding domain-containing protein [Armatimonadota bacterium]
MTAPVYHAPATLEEALALLGACGDEAAIVAGGQEVVPLLTAGRIAPRMLVDLRRLDALTGITEEPDTLRLGARVTHREIASSPVVRGRWSLLTQAAAAIGGGVQVLNRGTLGGALCAAHPAYDYAPCLVALQAVVVLASARGRRSLPVQTFFTGAGRTARRPDELLLEVRIPAPPPPTTAAYRKLRAVWGGPGVVNAACLVRREGDRLVDIRLTVGAVEETPVVVSLDHLRGAPPDAVPERAAEAAQDLVRHPIEDAAAGAAYRRAMAGVMARRAVAAAMTARESP